MQGYCGGIETQLGVIRLPKDGQPTAELSLAEATKEYRGVVAELIKTNNLSQLYGVPQGAYTDSRSWLFNGGTLYADMGHPEYATPEVCSIADAYYYTLAGRRIVENLLHLSQFGNHKHGVFANNTDFHGRTFAEHENYLVDGNMGQLVQYLLPFLITRQIYSGAGQVLPTPDRTGLQGKRGWFSIAQRSLFLNHQLSDQGERGENVYVGNYSVFAASSRSNKKLLHFTGGDSTTMRTTTMLKIGTTALACQAIEAGFLPDLRVVPRKHHVVVTNTQRIARDPNFNWTYQVNGYNISAIDVQWHFLSAMEQFAGRDTETDWTLKTLRVTLEALEQDPTSATWLDWPNKYKTLSALRAKNWSEPDLIKTDLAFHAADPDKSIFRTKGGYGADETQIARAMYHPPTNTRAAGRSIGIRAIGELLKRQPSTRYKPWIFWDAMNFNQTKILQMEDSRKTYVDEARTFQEQLEKSYPSRV